MFLKKRIKNIVGKFLEENKFELRTEKIYTAPSHLCFTRKHNEIIQTIVVGKSRYFDSLGFSLQTDAWGNPLTRASVLIPGFMERHAKICDLSTDEIVEKAPTLIPDFPYHINYLGEWPYDNETTFERALLEICDILEKYGLSELERMSQEEQIIPTDEMGEKLFASYEILSNQFITENNINVSDTSVNRISEWFVTITKIMTQVFNCPYIEVQDILLQIAAFLGERIRKELCGEWILGERSRVVLITNLNAFVLQSYYPLTSVVEAFKKQNVEILKEEYIIQLSAKLPMNENDMVAFGERLDQYRKGNNMQR